MLKILTDRGTLYCGKVEQHDYQLYLAINDIDHTKTKAISPQTNGICERFHKTILQGFYQVTFRKKLYADLESLKMDLDNWYGITIIRELIRGKCAANVRQWARYLMENGPGHKRI